MLAGFEVFTGNVKFDCLAFAMMTLVLVLFFSSDIFALKTDYIWSCAGGQPEPVCARSEVLSCAFKYRYSANEWSYGIGKLYLEI